MASKIAEKIAEKVTDYDSGGCMIADEDMRDWEQIKQDVAQLIDQELTSIREQLQLFSLTSGILKIDDVALQEVVENPKPRESLRIARKQIEALAELYEELKIEEGDSPPKENI